MNPLHKRILEIAYKNKLSHLSSALTAVDIIDGIYAIKHEDEPFLLSCGHCFLGLAVVLEKYYKFNAEDLICRHGCHPHRNMSDKVWFSAGSLGCGIPAATGFALADRKKRVFCLISDGESSSGPIYEALNFKTKYNLQNLRVHCNINGFSCLESLKIDDLIFRLKVLDRDLVTHVTSVPKELPFLQGVIGHYYQLKDADWEYIKTL